MTARFALAAALILLPLGLGACTPIAANQGFQVVDVSPGDIQAGVDTKATVNDKLGSPSATSTFDPNTWYYISENSSRVAFYKPRAITRTVVEIDFNPGDAKVAPADAKVAKVTKYGLEAGKVFAYNNRETPTLGRQLSVIEQLLGNLGQSAPFLNDDNQGVPGSRPGD